jgi:hypothetical protein
VARLVISSRRSVEADTIVDAEPRWGVIWAGPGKADTALFDDKNMIGYNFGPEVIPGFGVLEFLVVRVPFRCVSIQHVQECSSAEPYRGVNCFIY